MIGEESLSTYGEILEYRERLAVAFERDAAGVEIVTDWADVADPLAQERYLREREGWPSPLPDPIGTWEDDGGNWQDDAYPEEGES